jgi:hypothetical protein
LFAFWIWLFVELLLGLLFVTTTSWEVWALVIAVALFTLPPNITPLLKTKSKSNSVHRPPNPSPPAAPGPSYPYPTTPGPTYYYYYYYYYY